jgi:sugar O-acyltransferase (sialic acid O-acetyltransferase NeuD family)
VKDGIVLYGVGSPLVVEYEETCRRLGIAVVAAVRNRREFPAWQAHSAVTELEDVTSAHREVGCVCPFFTPENRRTAAAEASAAGFHFAPALIDSTAVIASSSSFGVGSFVNAGSIVGACSVAGEQVVVNRGSSVGHHVELGAFVSIAPGVVICGHAAVGPDTLIGAGAIVLPKVRIGAGSLIGAGVVVARDVPAGTRLTPTRGGAA